MAKFDYNLVVIGGGTAGLITANVAAQAKSSVALVERNLMGGDCLNTGCVPSKSLIASAKLAKQIRRSEEFGISTSGDVAVNFPIVMEQVQGIIDYIAPIDSRERYTELGCDCFEATAKIVSKHEVMIGYDIYRAAHIAVATGARPAIPPIPGLDELDHLDSDNLWQIRELPERLLVVGSGPIGCELAQAFSRLGSTVTVVSMDPILLAREDPDVSEHIHHVFEQEGIDLLLNANIKRFLNSDSSPSMEYVIDGLKHDLKFDRVLIATGRKPNTSDLGLEHVGVSLNQNGTIKVDKFLRSSVSNIWACGDVAGPFQFTHMASHQAGYVAMNVLASPFKRFAVDYSQVPWVTYTDPEIARVGLSETEAVKKGVQYDVTKFNLSHQDRAITERDNSGFVKVLTKRKSDRILGATIVGPHAGELLAEFNLAIKHRLGLKAIMGTIHPYPTFAEANRSVASEWRKKSIPHGMLKYAAKYFAFRRG